MAKGTMSPGRPNIPDSIKKASGTLRKSRVKEEVKLPEVSDLECPPTVRQEVKDLFKIIIDDMQGTGIIKTVDSYLLSFFALELHTYLEANDKLGSSDFWVSQTESGYKIVDPHFTIKNNALHNVLKLANQIGLTPVSRIKLGGVIKGKKDDDEKKNTPGKMIGFVKYGK